MRTQILPKSLNLAMITLILSLGLSGCGKDETSTGSASSTPKNITQKGILGTWTLDNDSIIEMDDEDTLKVYIEPTRITIEGHCADTKITARTSSSIRIDGDEIHVLKANKNRVTKGEEYCEVYLKVSSITFELEGENKLSILSSDGNSFLGDDDFFKRKVRFIRTP